MITRALLLLTILLGYNGLRAQNLGLEPQYSKYTYVYRLTVQQALVMQREYTLKPEQLINYPCVDSFITHGADTPRLGPGHYVFVQADKKMLALTYHPVTNLVAEVLDDLKKAKLVVRNKQGGYITGAAVKLGNRNIAYSTAAMAYLVRMGKNEKCLTIAAGTDTAIYLAAQPERDRPYRYRSSAKYIVSQVFYPFSWVYYKIRGAINKTRKVREGYIVFNKPKYQPNDTVRFKAFITNGWGKPLKRKADVTLATYYGKAVTIKSGLEPVTPGAYVYDFILADSFKTDVDYTLLIKDAKRDRDFKTGYFRAEDYLLKTSRYTLRSNEKTYGTADTLHFTFTGIDYNDLPVTDAQVNLKATVTRITRFCADSVFVPDSLFSFEGRLNAQGRATFSYPAAQLPPAALQINIKAQLRNSNNETWDTTYTLSYLGPVPALQVTNSNDSILAVYTVGGIPQPATGYMRVSGKDELLYTRAVSFPYYQRPDEFATAYYFALPGDSVNTFTTTDRSDDISCSAYRTDTSVYLRISNPKKIPVHYSLYRNQALVEKAEVVTLQKSIADRSNSTYTLITEWVWRGKKEMRKTRADKITRLLKVEVNNDEVVYPGQKDSFTISVTKYNGKPAPAVNLTAYSVNAQFGKDIDEPDYGISQPVRRLRQKFNTGGLTVPEFKRQHRLCCVPQWYSRMRLDSQAYYYFIFPPRGVSTYYDSLSTVGPQVAPYIYHKGQPVKLYSVHLDGQLVYSAENELPTPYSFATVLDGKHVLNFRTYNRRFVDTVDLKFGSKLEISYNYDSLLQVCPVPNAQPAYSNLELNELRRQMMFYNQDYDSRTFYLMQGIRTFGPRGGGIRAAGPFSLDSVMFYRPYDFTLNFAIEPQYAYNFSRNVMRLEKYNPHFERRVLTGPYNSYNAEIAFGQIATYQPVVLQVAPVPKARYQTDIYKPLSAQPNGGLQIDLVTDSVFEYLHLYRYDSTGYSKILGGTSLNLHGLPPGIYQLEMLTYNGYYLSFGNLTVKAGGINYYRLVPGTFYRQLGFKEASATMQTGFISADSAGYKLLDATLYGTASVIGRITDVKGQPLEYAVIKASNAGNAKLLTTITDVNGDFALRGLPGGTYTLTVDFLGYARNLRKIEVHNFETLLLNFVMREQVSYNLSEVAIMVPQSNNRNFSMAYSVGVQRSMLSMETVAMDVLGSRINYVPGVTVSSYKISNINLGYQQYGYANFKEEEEADSSDTDFNTYRGNTPGRKVLRGGSWKDLTAFYAGAKTMRNNFADYGFWQPNAVTGKDGKAAFAVQYPDNLTNWKTFVIARDAHKRSGYASKDVRSFKELTASLNAPQFLIEGDSTQLVGRVNNYINTPVPVHTAFALNGTTVSQVDTTVTTVATQQLRVVAPVYSPATDTLSADFSLSITGGYADGERKQIPVWPQGTTETKGFFAVLTTDTTFTVSPEAQMGTLTIHAEQDMLQVMLEEVKNLKNYPYWCTEQTASKLIALCMEQKIKQQLGEPFKGEKEKQQIIKKLNDMQLYDGAFGWFNYSAYNIHITAYVVKALSIAGVTPAQSNNMATAIRFLKDHYHLMDRSEQLKTLETLSTLSLAEDKSFTSGRLLAFQFDSLNLSQQMTWVKTLLLTGNDSLATPYWNRLLAQQQRTVFGGAYWGTETYNYTNNSNAVTLQAYRIAELKNDAATKQAVITGILTQRSHTGWRNTYESAEILSTLLPQIIQQRGSATAKPQLQLNGATVQQYPYIMQATNGQPVQVVKQGGAPVYFTAYQQFFNTRPEPVRNLYDITTAFWRGGQQITAFKGGEVAEMHITINAQKYADFVSIEVPIPAGCAYYKKEFPKQHGQVHREYFKNKVVIFCERLSPGQHTFTLLLEPRYTGSYTLNPVRAELMYFPTLYGRNAISRVAVE